MNKLNELRGDNNDKRAIKKLIPQCKVMFADDPDI